MWRSGSLKISVKSTYLFLWPWVFASMLSACTSQPTIRDFHDENNHGVVKEKSIISQPLVIRIKGDHKLDYDTGEVSIRFEKRQLSQTTRYQHIEIIKWKGEIYNGDNDELKKKCETANYRLEGCILHVVEKSVKNIRLNETKDSPKATWVPLTKKEANALKISLVSLRPSGEESGKIENVSFRKKGEYVLVNLRKQLESLPEKPYGAFFEFEKTFGNKFQNKNIAPERKIKITAQEIALMRLNAFHWLSVEQQKVHYESQLKAALIEKRYNDAIRHYANIELLGLPVSSEFYYRYAQSLEKSYNPLRAIRYYEKYLHESGSNARFSGRAKYKIQSLNN